MGRRETQYVMMGNFILHNSLIYFVRNMIYKYLIVLILNHIAYIIHIAILEYLYNIKEEVKCWIMHCNIKMRSSPMKWHTYGYVTMFTNGWQKKINISKSIELGRISCKSITSKHILHSTVHRNLWGSICICLQMKDPSSYSNIWGCLSKIYRP